MSVWNKEDEENNFLIELNNLRKDPKGFIPNLEKLLENFKGDILYRQGEVPLQTVEATESVKDCIEFLKNYEPVGELIRSYELSKAALDHANDIGVKGLVSHDGSDGSTVSDRIERYTEWEGTCAENLDFGSKSGLNCLISLLIDDGVQSRGHRKNLLNPRLKYIGIAAGNHKEYENCYVIVFTGGVREKDKPFYDYSNYKYQYPEDLENKKKDEKPKKIKNKYQLDDEDAPDNTVAVKTIKQTKLFNGRVHRVTKKFYTLSDGTTTIVEVEDI